MIRAGSAPLGPAAPVSPLAGAGPSARDGVSMAREAGRGGRVSGPTLGTERKGRGGSVAAPS